MNLFVSAGEPSGDLHGSNLVRAIHDRHPSANVVGFGGDRMAAAGADLHYPLTDLAVMWFGKAMANLPTFFKVGRRAEVYFRSQKPDALILIDYPGFNFALAKRAHRAGVPVYFFVPPQLWGWAGWRSEKMRKWVRTVLTALPFEDDWYRARGVSTQYVGHPYFDELAAQKLDPAFMASQRAKNGPLVALLPGSRNQEVTANFALMLAAAGRVREAVPDVRFLVAAFNERQATECRMAAAGSGLPVQVHVGRTPEIIESADAAAAVSGSVGLELMTRLTPTVVVYRVSPALNFVGRRLATCKYISLVNLLADEAVFPEHIPTGFDPGPVADHLIRWLNHPAERTAVVAKLRAIRDRAAVPGACGRAADAILGDLAAGGRRLAAA
jgi:lipid-A-disaccharide synthase